MLTFKSIINFFNELTFEVFILIYLSQTTHNTFVIYIYEYFVGILLLYTIHK